MLLLILLSLLLYAITIVIISHQIYSFDKKQKLQFIVLSLLVVLIITIVICNISSGQIQGEIKEKIEITKQAAIILFSPILSMILVPFFANIINRLYAKEMKQEEMRKRMILFGILAIGIIILSVSYIQNFQIGLLKVQ